MKHSEKFVAISLSSLSIFINFYSILKEDAYSPVVHSSRMFITSIKYCNIMIEGTVGP
jgi:hypothetical protein